MHLFTFLHDLVRIINFCNNYGYMASALVLLQRFSTFAHRPPLVRGHLPGRSRANAIVLRI